VATPSDKDPPSVSLTSVEIRDRLRTMLQLVRTVGEAQPQASAASVEQPAADPFTKHASVLRQRLAVRGWVAPLTAIPEADPSEAAHVLRAVAPDVEVAVEGQPGRWFMTTAARRRTFASTSLAQLRQETVQIAPSDEADPLLLAMRIVSGEAPASLESLKTDVLHELTRVAGWSGSRSDQARGAALELADAARRYASRAAALIQRRRRASELERASKTTVVGREDEQERIGEFLTRPHQVGGPIPALYVYGIGGAGKSTMLLDAEASLRKSDEAIVLHLDFDSPFVDVVSPERMDLLLLRQLRAEAPDAAEFLQSRIDILQDLGERRTQARIEALGTVQFAGGAKSVRSSGKRSRERRQEVYQGASLESLGVSEDYERISALGGVSTLPFMAGKPLVLFVDTLENVTRQGEGAIDALLRWVATWRMCAFEEDMRVVLAGRDDLVCAAMKELVARLEAHRFALDPAHVVGLGDLSLKAARQLLTEANMPPEAAELAAKALPRNPLVLRMAAMVYERNPEEALEIQESYRQAQIDRHTAEGYLAQRVVAHLEDTAARPYVSAAMVLPVVTEGVLRDIVIPAVDGKFRRDGPSPRAVYRGLQAATWLTVNEQSGTLRWHEVLRELALRMIEADPVKAELAARVRATAEVWSARRRSPEQRALAALLQGKAAGPVHEEAVHRLRLEGMNGRGGDGDRLVAQGAAPRALELYRTRPTRPVGKPPAFVLRALGDTAQWRTGEVDIGGVLEEMRRELEERRNGVHKTTMDCLRWLTRLQLMRTGQLTSEHLEVLRAAVSRLKFNTDNVAFLGLVATAEALHAPLPDKLDLLAPPAWPPQRARVGAESRFPMVRAVYGAIEAETCYVDMTLERLLVLNKQTPRALEELGGRELLVLDGKARNALVGFDALKDATLHQVEAFFARCRGTRVSIDVARIGSATAAWLLRGTTVEFHRPLGIALAAVIDPSGADLPGARDRRVSALGALVSFVRELRGWPPGAFLPLAEFDSQERLFSHASALESAVTSIVVQLDRARTLGSLCRALRELPRNERLIAETSSAAYGRLIDVCGRYLQWDRALDPLDVGSGPYPKLAPPRKTTKREPARQMRVASPTPPPLATTPLARIPSLPSPNVGQLHMDTRLDLLRELIAAAQPGSDAQAGQRLFPLRELRYALEYKDVPDLQEETDRVAALLRVSPPAFELRALAQGQALDRFLLLRIPGCERTLGTRELFAIGYALADALDLVSAEPDLGTDFYVDPEPPRHDPAVESAAVSGLCWVTAEPPADRRWALQSTRVLDAWSRSKGEGIVVAQPDTGVAAHDEIDASMFAVEQSYDVLDDDPNPTDPLTPGTANPGHGTGTASVLCSPEAGQIAGAAPLAKVAPIRCIHDVKVFDTSPVAAAISHAVSARCDVISMSLGGIPGRAMHAAVRAAVEADLIVVAAAGNCVRTVVWPARYDEVIAVAGSNVDDLRWKGSCRGSAVDITAPAELVWRAERSSQSDPMSVVGGGQGTSFAAALVAGIAALWLSRHGRPTVIAEARRRGVSVQRLFRAALRSTARQPEDWDTDDFGPGIADAQALLDLELAAIPEVAVESTAALERPSVENLVTEAFGPGPMDSKFPWHRYGAEMATIALTQAKLGIAPATLSQEAKVAGTRPSAALSAAAAASSDKRLAAFAERAGQTSVSRPLVRPGPSKPVQPERLRLALPRTPQVESAGRFDVERARLYLQGSGRTAQIERAQRLLSNSAADSPLRSRIVGEIDEALSAVARSQPLTTTAQIGLETLVRLTGRPALRVRQGAIDLADPRAEEWKVRITMLMQDPRFITRTRSVGRIDADEAHVGTGFVVGPGLVLTNRHVLQAFAAPVPRRNDPSRWVLTSDDVTIDFAEEPSPATTASRFKIKSVIGAGSLEIDEDRIYFDRLDAALLEVETSNTSGTLLPPPIELVRDPAKVARRKEVMVVGYPARPATLPTTESGDIDMAVATRLVELFGADYGNKYASPGEIDLTTGGIPGDTPHWTMTHDATTLGGNSGSCVIGFDEPLAVLGLHFGGSWRRENYAHVVTALARDGNFLTDPALRWIP
jgi:serine protease